MKFTTKLKFIIFILFLFFAIKINAQKIVINFATGSEIISDSEILKFAVLEKMNLSCSDVVTLNGYTDNVGKVIANNALSEKRTNAVKKIIYEFLHDSVNYDNLPGIEFNAYGSINPIANNNTEQGRQQNRRVEIVFGKKKCEEDNNKIGDLFELIKDKPQEFCIQPNKDTALIGKQGTIIYYKAGTFTNVTNCACVTLLLNEYLDNASFILNNLTTTSNGNALESGGMTRLVGLCGNDTLQYQPGKFLVVMVPTNNALPNMKSLFSGREKQSDYLNWDLDKNFPEVQILNWNGLGMACSTTQGPQVKDDCPLFLCKIRRFLKGKKSNVKYDKTMEKITEEEQLIKDYALNKDQLGDALLISKDVNANALKYYVYKNARWDYHNCDRYLNGNDFTNLYVKETPKPSKDVKLIYKLNKTVVPAFTKSKYEFYKVFDKNDVWIVGLKYKDNKSAYLSLTEENTSTKNVSLNFKEVTIEELKTVLKKLN